MWYVCDILYAMVYVRGRYFVVRMYINICNCDMFSVANVYLDHFKFCVVCINQCNEPIPALCSLSVRTVVKLCTLGVLALGVSLVS